ncbi:MAG: hypothetical protein V4732_07640 [Pseudomonadota bacterium]
MENIAESIGPPIFADTGSVNIAPAEPSADRIRVWPNIGLRWAVDG